MGVVNCEFPCLVLCVFGAFFLRSASSGNTICPSSKEDGLEDGTLDVYKWTGRNDYVTFIFTFLLIND
jgi:hypothetical protein